MTARIPVPLHDPPSLTKPVLRDLFPQHLPSAGLSGLYFVFNLLYKCMCRCLYKHII